MSDIGYTRCGIFFYKPDNSRSCCIQHTIRLNVDQFEISKSQKKVMQRFNQYLSGEFDEKNVKINENLIDSNLNSKDNNNVIVDNSNIIEQKLEQNQNEKAQFDKFSIQIKEYLLKFLSNKLEIKDKNELVFDIITSFKTYQKAI